MNPRRTRIAAASLLVLASCLFAAAWTQAAGDSHDLPVRAHLPLVANDEPRATTPIPSPATPTPTPSPTATPTATQPPDTTLSFDASRALEIARHLSVDIGERVAGTAGGDEAVAYLQGRFAAAGFTVELMPFGFESRYALASLQAAGQQLTAAPLTGSAGSSVTAPSLFAGHGAASDYAGRDAAGRIVVVDRGVFTFAQKATNAVAAGAAALVIVNNEAGGFSGTLGRAFPIPVVAVPGSARDLLLAEAAAGLALTVSVELPAPTAVNVIARPAPGSRCDLIVGGHYDTTPGSPGGNDNASGVASVVELARVTGPRPGVCFVAFGAEESGLWGSAALADQLAAAQALPAAVINLDVTGNGDDVELVGSASLRGRALQLAAAAGIPARPATLPEGSSSDHASFIEAGIPSILLTSGDYAGIHSPNDTFDRLNPVMLDATGELALALLLDLIEAR
ncbi:MAG: M28 family peptidase [Dehalococcoidia bacterium]|nr:M28 family peptidase [Dehalococcoidia bacterium]